MMIYSRIEKLFKVTLSFLFLKNACISQTAEESMIIARKTQLVLFRYITNVDCGNWFLRISQWSIGVNDKHVLNLHTKMLYIPNLYHQLQ